MRPIDWDLVPDDGTMVLLTVPDLLDDVDVPLQMADFKDDYALVFKKTGSYLGLTLSRGVRLGKGPARMVNGIWYINEDPYLQKIHADIELEPEMMALGLIK
jgi:hypothetical protein